MPNDNESQSLVSILNGITLEKTPQSLYEVFVVVQDICRWGINNQPIDNYGWLKYENIESIVERFSLPSITKEHIEDFVNKLSDEDIGNDYINMQTPHSSYRISGFTLSAFINYYAKEDDIIELDISHLRKLGYLGHLRHSKVILRGIKETLEIDSEGNVLSVDNNLGPGIGEFMEGGELEIFGDYLGDQDFGRFMKGGKLILHGNAGYGVFRCMENGEGIIYGDVPHGMVGVGMNGGKITIHGHVGIDTKFFPKRTIEYPNVGFDSSGGEIYLLGSYEDMAPSNPKMLDRKCLIYSQGNLLPQIQE